MDKNIKSVLENRPVLVTGADGFIGSHLTEILLHNQADIYVFIRATSSGALHNIISLQKKIHIIRGDLVDKTTVFESLKMLKSASKKAHLKPIIFHLGAQAHVGESWQRPYETINTNIIGTLNILQCIVDLELNLYKLDTAGSSEEYGNIAKDIQNVYEFDKTGGLILNEKSPINPQSIYATSKVAADFLTRNYNVAYGIPSIITRMFNNYGPRQNPRFITGTIITQALKRDTIELGDLAPKRDFCFVKDGVQGHIYATLFGRPGNVYTFGGGKTISIADWYDLIMKIGRKKGYWGKKKLITHKKERDRLGKSEVEELRVDYTNLNSLSSWTPKYSWEQGLQETIAWYAENEQSWGSRIDWL